jgi:hypothetical protein
LDDEVLDFLETSVGQVEEDITMSLHALRGTENSRCIRLRALIKNQMILKLLDSGSSNTFVSSMTVDRLQCEVLDMEPVEVNVANGQVLLYNN